MYFWAYLPRGHGAQLVLKRLKWLAEEATGHAYFYQKVPAESKGKCTESYSVKLPTSLSS